MHRRAQKKGGAGASAAVDALLGLEPMLLARGPVGLLAQLAEEALTHDLDDGRRARATAAHARALFAQGRTPEAKDGFDAALALSRASADARLEALLLVDLGVWHHQRRELETSEALYSEALRHFRATRDRRGEGRALGNLGAVAHDRRRFAEAVTQYREALGALRTTGDRRLEGIFRGNLALVEQEQGETDRAWESYDRALELLDESGDRRLWAITLGNQGMLHHEEGRTEAARAAHERAAAALRDVGDVRSQALATARLGAALAARGLPEEARRRLREAARLAAESGDALVEAMAELCLAFADLADRRQALAKEDAAGATAAWNTVQRRLQRVREGSPSAAELSDDVRAMLRLLEQDVGAAALAPEEALLVAPETSAFRAPGGEWQSLAKKRSMRLVLAALVEARQKAPGRGVGLEALVAAGWPGERMSASASANRLYVLLAKLREAGLRDQLQRHDDGWLLDPALAVHPVNRPTG